LAAARWRRKRRVCRSWSEEQGSEVRDQGSVTGSRSSAAMKGGRFRRPPLDLHGPDSQITPKIRRERIGCPRDCQPGNKPDCFPHVSLPGVFDAGFVIHFADVGAGREFFWGRFAQWRFRMGFNGTLGGEQRRLLFATLHQLPTLERAPGGPDSEAAVAWTSRARARTHTLALPWPATL
jgi:hypothetical protein